MFLRQPLLLLILFCGLAFPQSQGQRPVAIEDEAHHHVVLKNEYVEIIRATLAPGQRTLYHIHAYDNAGVELSNDVTTEEVLGKPEGAAATSKLGDVWAEALPGGKPYAHRVRNAGNTTMDVFVVQFLRPASSPDLPPAALVAAENAEGRVYNWRLAPGAASTMHTHHRPYVIVSVTPMDLKMASPDGRTLQEQVKPGDFH